jgi:hypothetical protein
MVCVMEAFDWVYLFTGLGIEEVCYYSSLSSLEVLFDGTYYQRGFGLVAAFVPFSG